MSSVFGAIAWLSASARTTRARFMCQRVSNPDSCGRCDAGLLNRAAADPVHQRRCGELLGAVNRQWPRGDAARGEDVAGKVRIAQERPAVDDDQLQILSTRLEHGLPR